MVCLVWTVIWFICAHNSPAEHPYISERERDYIEDAIGHKQHEQVLLFALYCSIYFLFISHENKICALNMNTLSNQ